MVRITTKRLSQSMYPLAKHLPVVVIAIENQQRGGQLLTYPLKAATQFKLCTIIMCESHDI